jgi:hypothetical protein
VSSDKDFEQRESVVRAWIQEQAKRAIALRSKEREFHGLEREFFYHQAQMYADYERTRDLKHPRDLGDAREHILRDFLRNAGYIPRRYGISERSVRVVSTTGHISNEIDIALYDLQDSITLMQRQDVYEVYPIESIYGVIQVKSTLTKKELQSGLKNLSSFKKLERPSPNKKNFTYYTNKNISLKGFAFLFAYNSDMTWEELVREINKYAETNPAHTLPNGIFILNRGHFFFGDGSKVSAFNEDIENFQRLSTHGYPDRQNICLYIFVSVLLELLYQTFVTQPKINCYFRLPLIAEDYSYSFTLGSFAEIGHCENHGDFSRKISAESLEKIVKWCETAEPINWLKATHIAYGIPENEEAYCRQPGDIRIYNPDSLELNAILVYYKKMSDGNSVPSMAFDMMEAGGMNIWLPYYYSAKESLISDCPKCSKNRLSP